MLTLLLASLVVGVLLTQSRSERVLRAGSHAQTQLDATLQSFTHNPTGRIQPGTTAP